MKAYKGFNKDMTCSPNGVPFQYEEGKEYHEDNAELCESGFHACVNPLDCFGYYAPGESVYHEVELDELSDEKSDDSKICGKHIKIGARLSVAKICELHFEFVKSRTTSTQIGANNTSLSGGCRSSLSGGHGSSLSGGFGSSLSGGDGSSLSGGFGSSLSGRDRSSISGGHGSSLSGGDRSSISGGCRSSLSGGDGSSLSGGYRSFISGGFGSSLSGGDGSSLSGGYGSSISGGDGSYLSGGDGSSLSGGHGSSLSGGYGSSISGRGFASGGENSIVSVRGNNVKAKGGIGSVLVIAKEYSDSYIIKEWKAEIVDGEKIKPDTWYKLENGEFVEVEDGT